jgi:hypothetical protein
MPKHFLCFLLLTGTLYSYSSTIISLKEPKAYDVFFTLPGTSISLSLADYTKLKPSDFRVLTGKKLTLKETISFKITQRQINKTIKKDGTVDLLAFHKKSSKPFKWHWGGFFLGLLLPIVGLLLAALIKDDKKKDRANSAAIGTLVACAVFLLFVLSSF